MKALKSKTMHLEEYDVNINLYLTYSQIQNIIDTTKIFDSWAEREQNIDMLILYYATDIPKETVETLNHDDFVNSGLMAEIKNNIKNLELIEKGLRYTESIERGLSQLNKALPDMVKPLKTLIQEKFIKEDASTK